jgi:hypothetical protein
MPSHRRGRALRRRYGHAPRGQGQLAIHSYMAGRADVVTLADMMRHPSFRGLHMKSVMSAAEALKKQGLIAYDGRALRWIGSEGRR